MSTPISLGDLARLEVDLDAILPSRDHSGRRNGRMGHGSVTSGASSEFQHLAYRGRKTYAESLSSIDSDSHNSSISSHASSHQSSMISNASSTRGRGKTLVLLGLSSAEVIAVKREQREVAKTVKDKGTKKKLNKTSFFASIEEDTVQGSVATSSADAVSADRCGADYPTLQENDLMKLIDAIGSLNKSSSENIRTLLDNYIHKTQHFILRNAKKVCFLVKSGKLLGTKKKGKSRKLDKKEFSSGKTAKTREHIAFGEWVNKHVFYPKSVHLHEGGGELFLYIFRGVLFEESSYVLEIRRQGFPFYRKVLSGYRADPNDGPSPRFPHLLDGMATKADKETILSELQKLAKKRGKKAKDRSYKSRNRHTPKEKIHSPPGTSVHKEKWEKVESNEGNVQTFVSKRSGKVLNYHPNYRMESYAEESGQRIYNNGRFSLAQEKDALSNPFKKEEWESFMNENGTIMFTNVITGEIVPEIKSSHEEHAEPKPKKGSSAFGAKAAKFFRQFSFAGEKGKHAPQNSHERRYGNVGDDVFEEIA